MPIASVAARMSLPRGLAQRFLSWTAIILLSLIGFVSATLLVRRLAGALESPLSTNALLAVGAISAMLAATVRFSGPVFQPSSRSRNRGDWRANIPRLIPTAALLVSGFALSLPNTSVPGLIALWTFPLFEEFLAWFFPRFIFHRLSIRRFDPIHHRSLANTPLAVSRTLSAPTQTILDASISQNFLRTTLADGLELIRGQMRIQFVAGQRSAAAHLAFCPPFEETPRVEHHQTSGPVARVKLAQAYPYGARFEVKLAAVAAESTSAVLDFSVTGKSLTIV